jgi:predicted TIM-barrel fold metal-dependent hydrolase
MTDDIDRSCFAPMGEMLDRWCVWSKYGRRPCFWHPTRHGAEHEAKRLARNFPKQKFIVLHAVSKFGVEQGAEPEPEEVAA